ncbi:protein of unknown function (DU1801) [Mucilaginibacter lappiensis]|uniref:YdhG-like domain-containing protein n=1 Tax=Mucilaginibacter lappiensis TaxID=354630 RepID=A0ABR6PPB3_9SPHI|nr:DUF1801 domain-containing protein [Mucilaginibacter lappiensis]MBB6111611.1 hypothetical protein [Mucilaginibacter lappiensis]SIR84615.1 protein of unknown function (DU1801) [Mucilaginibacter lappiensis]
MAENKTKETTASVAEFLNAVADETKRKDSFRLVQIMEEQTGLEAKMWGPAIVGFGSCHYKYESGREGDMPMVAFSPRKAEITLYLMQDPVEKEKLLANFGKYKTGKGCIYVKKLQDIHEDVLREMITSAVGYLKTKYCASIS